ncbi:MAG: RNA 2',3'-cyclic phosphodiesterase [Pirellulaceae bacterium]
MKPVRTFIAINLSESARDAAESIMDDLERCGDAVRTVARENLYITLKFLGEIQIEETVKVCKIVTQAALMTPQFSIVAAGTGAFPDRERLRVIWWGMEEGSEQLGALHDLIDQGLSNFGYPGETKKYHPHVTLARVRSRELDADQVRSVMDRFREEPSVEFLAEEIVVYSSFLGPDGPRYEVVGRSPLS